MINKRRVYAIEFTAIALLWTLVVLAPIIFIDDFNGSWRAVHVMWSECVVVGIAYIINRFALMPYLFFAKRYVAYIVAVAVLLSLLAVVILHFDGVNIIVGLFGEDNMLPPPRGGGFAPPHNLPPMATPPTIQLIPPAISVLIVSVLVMALDLGIRIAATWVIAEQRQAAINRERVVAQLQNLQSQVSPHFFLNTLNNIHALVDIDSKRAKSTIIELSNLMSYLLYECSSKESVPLQREVDFIGDYISLMRLRYSSHVVIEFVCGENIPAVDIPPLLFLNFIENAFKYGVDYDRESIIKIRFKFTDRAIEMSTLNSNHSISIKTKQHGLGIVNSRKRLDMIYGDRYSLEISDKEQIYYVNLKIPIL